MQPVQVNTLGLDLESRAAENGETCKGERRFSVDLRSRAKAAPDSNACVVVIDDDPEFRESLGRLLRSVGLHSRLFASIADFLDLNRPIALPVWSSM